MKPHNLPKEVEKLLKKQAELDKKTDSLISHFVVEHNQTEIFTLVDFIIGLKVPKHTNAINEFLLNYNEDNLTLKDVKVYLDLLDMHKEKMKEPKNNTKNSVVEGQK